MREPPRGHRPNGRSAATQFVKQPERDSKNQKDDHQARTHVTPCLENSGDKAGDKGLAVHAPKSFRIN
jgi:hypothetical protein